MFGRGKAPVKRRIAIWKDDPSKCGCDDQYSVVELDAAGRLVKMLGKEIKGYAVAKNIKDLAESGRI